MNPPRNLNIDTNEVVTVANLTPFEYDMLSTHQIRILVPDSTDSSGLSWELKTVNMDDPSLHFTALSYVWACDTHPDTFLISCNKHRLYVHYNLYTALPFIARRYNSNKALATPYWIDAICINQADDEEKTSQIRLMNRIYRQADRVLVWLNLTDNPESQAFIPRAIELLPLLVKEFARSRQYLETDADARLTPDFVVDRKLGYLGRRGWEAIINLIRNPYFRRVWTVQEIALAKEITFLCGEHEIESQLIEKVVYDSWHIRRWTLYDLTTDKPMRYTGEYHNDSNIFVIRDIIKYDGDEGNAHQAIRIANIMDEQACSAPQDRVLGILGMVSEELRSGGAALHMYTSITDLYTRFSTLLFQASGLTKTHWWFYMSMAFRKNRIEGLPSWVPDLHHNDASDKRYVFDNMMSAQGYSETPWQASSRPRKAAHGPRPGEIILRGKLLEKITHAHPEVPYGFPVYTDPPDTTGMKWLYAVVAVIRWEHGLSSSLLRPESSPAVDRTNEQRCHVSADTYWRSLLADCTKDYGTRTQFTLGTWREFQEQGQRFLALVPMLEQLKRYVNEPVLFVISSDNIQ